MNCQQAEPLIEPYADGELEAAAILELEQHFKGCPDCASELRKVQSLKKALKQDALYFAAPEELRQRIKSALPSPAKAVPRQTAGNWFEHWNWLTTALSGATAVCLALILVLTLTRPSLEQPFAQEVVSSHIRSLMGNHLMDVASTDQHTVKPWFSGRLDFSPPVKDLAVQEFPLIGGRLDYLGGRNVAALIFQRNKHVINLFIWPAKVSDSKPEVFPSQQGYHLIHWSDAGMIFWVVSDLNEKELMEFVQDYTAAIPLK